MLFEELDPSLLPIIQSTRRGIPFGKLVAQMGRLEESSIERIHHMTSKLGVDLPHKWAGNENWKDIEVDNGEVSYNAIGRPLYRQCKIIMSGIIVPKNNSYSCGGEAHYIVTRTSTLTGRTYTDCACLYHAKMWINPNA